VKRPSFQFYPADWRKDAALQSCSLEARGLWIECMCIAHECEPYGHLVINGRPMTAPQIARLVGVSAKECDALLIELVAAGVAEMADGVLFSRRMVRDEALRNRRAEGGKEHGHKGSDHGKKGAGHGVFGGRPRAGKGVEKPPLNPPLGDDGNPPNNPPSEGLTEAFKGVEKPPINPPPSSSSSSSSSRAEAKAEAIPASPAEKPGEEPDLIWSHGLAWMKRKGVPEGKARSTLGLVVKETSRLVTGELLRVAEAEDVIDPVAWLLAAAQRRKPNVAQLSLVPVAPEPVKASHQPLRHTPRG